MGGINHQEWGKTIASYNLSTENHEEIVGNTGSIMEIMWVNH